MRHFVGREPELKQLDTLLSQDVPGGTVVITAISGTGGIGKTALALRWGHEVAAEFPDGQLYVNLRGYDPGGVPLTPAEAIRGFLDVPRCPAHRGSRVLSTRKPRCTGRCSPTGRC